MEDWEIKQNQINKAFRKAMEKKAKKEAEEIVLKYSEKFLKYHTVENLIESLKRAGANDTEINEEVRTQTPHIEKINEAVRMYAKTGKKNQVLKELIEDYKNGILEEWEDLMESVVFQQQVKAGVYED